MESNEIEIRGNEIEIQVDEAWLRKIFGLKPVVTVVLDAVTTALSRRQQLGDTLVYEMIFGNWAQGKTVNAAVAQLLGHRYLLRAVTAYDSELVIVVPDRDLGLRLKKVVHLLSGEGNPNLLPVLVRSIERHRVYGVTLECSEF